MEKPYGYIVDLNLHGTRELVNLFLNLLYKKLKSHSKRFLVLNEFTYCIVI